MATTTSPRRQRRPHPPSVAEIARRDRGAAASGDDWLDQHLGLWRSTGIVSDEQCAAIREFERPADVARPTPPALSIGNEAIAYLGSLLALAGGAVVVAHAWESMAFPARLSIGAAIAILGFLAGAALVRRHDPAMARLASFLWVVGTGGVVMTIGTAMEQWRWEGPQVAFAIGIPVLGLGLGLWRNLPRPLQLLTAVVGLAITAAAFASMAELSVWSMGVATMAAALTLTTIAVLGYVEPRETAIVVGAVGAIVGGAMLGDLNEHLGGIAAAVVAAGVVTLALATHRTPLLVVGVYGFLQALQAILVTTLSGPVASAIVTLVGIVAVTAVIARSLRRSRGPAAGPADDRPTL